MRDRLGLIVLSIVGLLLIAIVLLVVVRSRPPAPQDGPDGAQTPANATDGADGAEDGPPEGPDMQLSGVALTIREEGEVIWRATFGGEIEMDEEQQLASATDVLWEFQGRGFEDLTLKAPVMHAVWNEKRLTFSGGILIEGEGGRLRFSARNAEYQFGTRKIIGRGDVRFQRGNYHGRAEEVVVDNSSKIVRLKRGSLSYVP